MSEIFLLGIVAMSQNRRLVSIFYRSQVSDSRTHCQNFLIVLSKKFHELRDLWTWTDKRHVTLEYINELRDLIDFGPAQETPA